MPESPSTRLVWHRLEAVDYMLSDLVDALVLLHNVGVIDEDEQRRLVEKAAKMFPLRATEEEAAAERAAEQAADERAAKRAGDWVREDFDPHSELTKERDGDRADAIAEQRERERWGL